VNIEPFIANIVAASFRTSKSTVGEMIASPLPLGKVVIGGGGGGWNLFMVSMKNDNTERGKSPDSSYS